MQLGRFPLAVAPDFQPLTSALRGEVLAQRTQLGEWVRGSSGYVFMKSMNPELADKLHMWVHILSGK